MSALSREISLLYAWDLVKSTSSICLDKGSIASLSTLIIALFHDCTTITVFFVTKSFELIIIPILIQARVIAVRALICRLLGIRCRHFIYLPLSSHLS